MREIAQSGEPKIVVLSPSQLDTLPPRDQAPPASDSIQGSCQPPSRKGPPGDLAGHKVVSSVCSFTCRAVPGFACAEIKVMNEIEKG